MRSLAEISRVRPAYRQAARGAAAWAACFGTGIAAGSAELGLQAAFVGMFVGFADDTLGLWRRLRNAVGLALLVALVTFVGVVVASSVALSVVTAACIAFGTGVVAVFGLAGRKVAAIVGFLGMFAIGMPGSPVHAAELALASLAGGAVGVIAIVVSLPFDRDRSLSRAAVRGFEEARRLAEHYARSADEPELSAERTRAVATIRDTHADARMSLGAARESGAGAYVLAAHRIMGAMSMLDDVRSLSGVAGTPETARIYRELGAACGLAALAVDSTDRAKPDVGRAVVAIDERIDAHLDQLRVKSREGSLYEAALRDLGDAVRFLSDTFEARDADATVRHERGEFQYGPTAAERIRAAFGEDTIFRRHALRYAALVALATALYKLAEIPDGFFIPVGIAIMLQPDLGTGISRLRVFSGGTVIGAVIGAVVGVYLGTSPFAIVAVEAVVVFALIAYVNSTYWAFAAGISIVIVSGLGLVIPGGWDLGAWRIINTLIAAGITALGLLLLWPSRGLVLVPHGVAHTLDLVAGYLGDVAGGGDRAYLERRRRRVVAAEGVLGLRIDEYAKEPGHGAAALVEFHAILAEIRRIRSSVSALAVVAALDPSAGDRGTVALAATVTRAIRWSADAFRQNRKPREEFAAAGFPREPTAAQADLMMIGTRAISLVARLPVPRGQAMP